MVTAFSSSDGSLRISNRIAKNIGGQIYFGSKLVTNTKPKIGVYNMIIINKKDINGRSYMMH